MTTTRTKSTRGRFTRDSAWLRRARRHYAQLIRPWVEEMKKPEDFRGRLWLAAAAARKHGLYAPGTLERYVMIGLLSNWCRHDAAKWWPWMHKDKRRHSVMDWSIKSRQIRREAERVRMRA